MFEQGYSAGEDFLSDVAVKYWRALGDEAVDQFMGNFSEARRVMMWKRILKSESLRDGNIFHEEMAQRLRKFPDDGIYGEMKEVVWLYWVQLARRRFESGDSWAETLENYRKELPEKFADDFKKACLDEVERIGKGGGE